ncbi:MAG: beta-lactamase family protein [Alphaproteobacteria bacterium]|nr:beta-lactamase family protein [Alphaproteobacteria bacterium]
MRQRLHTRLRTPPPAEVTRRGPEAPTSLPLEGVWRDVLRLYRTGLHPAIALTIRHRGEVVMDRTVGHLEHLPGGPPGDVITPETPISLFSASKILTALLVHALAEDGLLDLDERVDHYLPGFGRHGKQDIRLHHLLSHTAGIPHVPEGVDVLEVLATGQVDLEPFFEARPESAPGERSAYHPLTSWVLLDEIVQRASGQDLREIAAARILEPLGFRSMNYGVPEHETHTVARHAFTGARTPSLMGRVFQRTVGVDPEVAVQLSNGQDYLTSVLPSVNVISTGREVTRFLDLLLRGGELDGTRVLEPTTVQRMITEATPRRLDGTFGFPMRYGLGVMMGGDRFSLFGPRTRGAFGMLGFSAVVVYADPSRELSVSFLNTGKPMFAPGMLQWFKAVQRISLVVPRSR